MENNVTPRKYIYILHPVRAKVLTEEQIQKNYKIYLMQYEPKNPSFQYYKDLNSTFHDDIQYEIAAEDVAYFDNEKEALQSAMANICDFNDGGLFNFALVEKLPMNYGYPNTEPETDYWLFEYQPRTMTYSFVSFDKDELTKAIQKKYDMFWDVRDERTSIDVKLED